MDDIHSELIQFFKEQKFQYNFLLHRTKSLSNAVSIMQNGLYFEENLLKVTDQLSGDMGRSLTGNKLFYRSYGEHIIIIAVPKSIEYTQNNIVQKVEEDALGTTITEEDYGEFNEMYHLSPKYILGYNYGLSRKIRYNKKFGFFLNALDKSA